VRVARVASLVAAAALQMLGTVGDMGPCGRMLRWRQAVGMCTRTCPFSNNGGGA
jgi:hypothetical protein